MTRSEFLIAVRNAHIREDAYCLEGGLPNESLTLSRQRSGWRVYYSERGRESGPKHFRSESDALEYLYTALMASPTARNLKTVPPDVAKDKYIIVAKWDDKHSIVVGIHKVRPRGGRTYVPIFSNDDQFNFWAWDTPFEKDRAEIDRKQLYSMLSDDDVVQLDPFSAQNVELCKADFG